MSQLRVVVYAEGRGETAAEARLPAPLELLSDAHLGPAHILLRRAIARARNVDARAVEFLSPLTIRGRTAQGSDLHDPATVRKLLAFLRVIPQLAIVLVDADGDVGARRRPLQDLLESRPFVVVHAIAVQEFESWLIADVSAASKVLNRRLDEAPEPDGMTRGDAKERWHSWSEHVNPVDRARTRAAVAEQLDIDLLARRSKSFARLLDDLRPT